MKPLPALWDPALEIRRPFPVPQGTYLPQLTKGDVVAMEFGRDYMTFVVVGFEELNVAFCPLPSRDCDLEEPGLKLENAMVQSREALQQKKAVIIGRWPRPRALVGVPGKTLEWWRRWLSWS